MSDLQALQSNWGIRVDFRHVAVIDDVQNSPEPPPIIHVPRNECPKASANEDVYDADYVGVQSRADANTGVETATVWKMVHILSNAFSLITVGKRQRNRVGIRSGITADQVPDRLHSQWIVVVDNKETIFVPARHDSVQEVLRWNCLVLDNAGWPHAYPNVHEFWLLFGRKGREKGTTICLSASTKPKYQIRATIQHNSTGVLELSVLHCRKFSKLWLSGLPNHYGSTHERSTQTICWKYDEIVQVFQRFIVVTW